MKLAILAMQTSAKDIFLTPEQKFRLNSAVGEKLLQAPAHSKKRQILW